jgi:transglutaminase-like putative cysteine protease
MAKQAMHLCQRILLLCGILALYFPSARAADDWLPITPDDLKMTSEPKAPGAPAIYLYRQVDYDDQSYRQTIYERIKIFTDEGRKYADIEIPFEKGINEVKNIQARTIHPDGTIINFDGQTYEKMILKAKGLKYMAKTFTMPAAQTGSIIEYRYVFTSSWANPWLLNAELFTKNAKFSLRRSTFYALRLTMPRGLPAGTSQPVYDRYMVRLETHDVPAFQIEDYMPPQNEMKYRVEFRYSDSFQKDADKFWQEESKLFYAAIDRFADKRKAMQQAVAQIVSPADTPEQKLRKIYARCQQVRNTSYEEKKTQQEMNRDKIKRTNTVEDVWKRGYGDGWDITWLFLALARAAGLDASPVLISTRDQHFFDKNLMNPYDLNTNVVQVKLAGTDLYLDPGVAFAPYAMLPWAEAGVAGLRLGKDGGTWITTTTPAPSASGVNRSAVLTLDDTGSLEGKATVTFKGLSALSRRIEERALDDAARKKNLEDEVKSYIPGTVEAELTNTPDWKSASETLIAEFDVKITGWTASAGHRTLLPVGLFGGSEKHVFEHITRVYPIYFSYAYSDVDAITIALPAGTQVASVPPAQNIDAKTCSYGMKAEQQNGVLHLNRSLTVNLYMVGPANYGPLRNFFLNVRNLDEEQIVLSSAVDAK